MEIENHPTIMAVVDPGQPIAIRTAINALADVQQRKGLIVTDGGTILLQTGPHWKLTNSLAKLLAKSKKNQRAEDFRFYQDFLEFAGQDPDDPLAFLHKSYADGVDGIVDALRNRGLVVEKQTNLSDSYDVTTTDGFPNYLGRYPRRIRVLFQQLIDDKLHPSPANPGEIAGWHGFLTDKKLEIAKATISSKYGYDYAGMRFVVKGRQKHLGRPQNPEGVCEDMTAAVVNGPAPEEIKILTHIYHGDSPRLNEALPANALGWKLGHFAGTIYVQNKWGSERPDKPIAIAPNVESWLVRRFTGIKHPTDPDKTMMDHLRELASAGDDAALADIILFPSAKTGKAYSKSGFRYWFQDSMLTEGVKADGWTPSPHFYRNGRMHEKVTAIFRETKPGPERTRRLAEAGEEFGHESSSWASYTRYARGLEARRITRERAAQRQREAAARRAGLPLPPRLPRLANPAAEAAHSTLPRRTMQ